MEFRYGTLIGIWAIIIGIYILFKLLNKPDNKLDKELQKIITSEEHKVK